MGFLVAAVHLATIHIIYSRFHPTAWLVDKFHDLLFFNLGGSRDRKQGGDTAIDEYCLFF